MAEPFFWAMLVRLDEAPGKSRCPKCKKMFFTGNYFVAVKFLMGGKVQWYLAGESVECCNQKGKTIWATDDEQKASEKGKKVLGLLRLADSQSDKRIFNQLVQAPSAFVPLLDNADRASAHQLN